MLDRPDIAAALGAAGLSRRPTSTTIPSTRCSNSRCRRLCADRLDYFLRDGLACGVVSREAADRILGTWRSRDRRIVMTDVAVAREAVRLFEVMNRDWWASATEAFIYNEFADALREGMRPRNPPPRRPDDRGRPRPGQARRGRHPVIASQARSIRHFRPESARADTRRASSPKARWLDPPVLIGHTVTPLSVLESQGPRR